MVFRLRDAPQPPGDACLLSREPRRCPRDAWPLPRSQQTLTTDTPWWQPRSGEAAEPGRAWLLMHGARVRGRPGPRRRGRAA
ncbi:hypothetical protein ABZ614_28775 [Streptomyces sp. NPDC013178]|uniref:hypothetical protein n=1 Tax=unclassified Streptomyces TaxID=2593676 RepID=UPI0033BFF704